MIPNVSLVPENDPTLLFVNSGMFPLVPYLSGESHPLGRRLVNVQRAGRFDVDLEEVGDPRHTTAFHMIGNWSLGDYFKDQQLPWAYEFLIEVLGLDPTKFYATVFAGDEYAPKDTESIKILKQVFSKYGIDAHENERIFACGRDKNWWQRGEAVGELGGPDSEIYYYLGDDLPIGRDPTLYEDEFLELGNSVFMQYRRTDKGWEELPQKNVDFGGGLERTAMVEQGKSDIFETDNFRLVIDKVQEISDKDYRHDPQITKAMRIIADHMRGTTLMAMDSVIPGNKDQGYIMRRLLRRVVRAGMTLGVESNMSLSLVPVVCEMMEWLYPQLPDKEDTIKQIFSAEEEKFKITLRQGKEAVEKFFNKAFTQNIKLLAGAAFSLYQSIGYPEEMFYADLHERNIQISEEEFYKEFKDLFKKHQEGSRTGAEQKFKGGLVDSSEQVVKYHTATHLLHMALRKVLGDGVMQQGSNITSERLRFDFNYHEKLSDDQIRQVENIINSHIGENLPVQYKIMPRDEAERTGAIHFFGEKYGDQVKVYFIGPEGDPVSAEFCNGPHVSQTREIGIFKITKQESLGKGVKRIRATVEP